MKQYTTPEQTAKLIELGFEKPCSIASVEPIYGMGGISIAKAYSIGELIEMLGTHLSSIYYIGIEWFVNAEGIECRRAELIDALYYMCIKLREEGVI